MMLFGIDQTQYCRDMLEAQTEGWLSFSWDNLDQEQLEDLLQVYGDHVRLSVMSPPVRDYFLQCPLEKIEAALSACTRFISTLDGASFYDIEAHPYQEFELRLRDLAESTYLGACSIFLKRGLLPAASRGFCTLGTALGKFDVALRVDPRAWLGDRVGFLNESHWAARRYRLSLS